MNSIGCTVSSAVVILYRLILLSRNVSQTASPLIAFGKSGFFRLSNQTLSRSGISSWIAASLSKGGLTYVKAVAGLQGSWARLTAWVLNRCVSIAHGALGASSVLIE